MAVQKWEALFMDEVTEPNRNGAVKTAGAGGWELVSAEARSGIGVDASGRACNVVTWSLAFKRPVSES